MPFSEAHHKETKTSSTTLRGGYNVRTIYCHIMIKKSFSNVAFIEKFGPAERFPSRQKRSKKILSPARVPLQQRYVPDMVQI